ncbi:hypothetical protein V8C86DRAFT_3136977 [Haematococcus lacustris]
MTSLCHALHSPTAVANPWHSLRSPQGVACASAGRSWPRSALPLPWPCLAHDVSSARSNAAARMLPVTRAQPWRPDMNDVDSLSRGGRARVRGTGSRDVPHRLNAEERVLYNAAKKKGFLAVRGSGYRKERKGHPLPNVWRQWCDANRRATVVVEQDTQGGPLDCCCVDLASLRQQGAELAAARQTCLQLAAECGLQALQPDQRSAADVPFNILPDPFFTRNKNIPPSPAPGQAAGQQQGSGQGGAQGRGREEGEQGAPNGTVKGGDGAGAVGLMAGAGVPEGSGVEGSGQDKVAAAEAAVVALAQEVAAVARAVRELKEGQGLGNADPQVREYVAQLKACKAKLTQAEAAAELARLPRSPRAAALFSVFQEAEPGGAVATSTGTEGAGNAADDMAAAGASQGAEGTSSRGGSGAAPQQPAESPGAEQGEGQAAGHTPEGLEAGDGGPHPLFRVAIWALPADPLFFRASRAAAKVFAAKAAAQLTTRGMTIMDVDAAVQMEEAGGGDDADEVEVEVDDTEEAMQTPVTH